MDLKQWHCKNKHALGMIRLNGNGIPQLMLYRHAVDLAADQPAQVDVMMGPLTGQMLVQCDICSEVAFWGVSVDALADLIRGLKCDICSEVAFWGVSVDALADLIRGLKRKQLEQLEAKLMKENAEKSKRLRSQARFE